ncbi:MAG TPA: hypothetical protein VE422_05230 [Terriglobia bacterium]|nr:hypothetical protein [Terriglobia bacterium]
MLLYLWYLSIIVGGVFIARRFGRLVSVAFMIEIYQVGLLIFGLITTGYLWPALLIPGVGVLPGIGIYSGISAGGLIPPLLFLLVAMLVSTSQPIAPGSPNHRDSNLH